MSTKEDMIHDNVIRLTDKIDTLSSQVQDNNVMMAKYTERMSALENNRDSDRNNHKELSNRVLAHERVVIDKLDGIIEKISTKVEERDKKHEEKISEIKKKMDDSHSKTETRLTHLETRQNTLMEAYNKRTIQDRVILAFGAIGGGITVLMSKNATEIFTRWFS